MSSLRYRSLKLAKYPVFFVMLTLADIALAQKATLSFVKSPSTNLHVELQPQNDHDRVHVFVQVRNGGGQRFEASISCQGDEHFSSDLVQFIQLKNDQTWSIYLRAPKWPKESALYTIQVKSIDPTPAQDRTSAHPLIYRWRVNRQPDGTTKFVNPPPGKNSPVQYTVNHAVSETLVDGTIKWKMLYESKTLEISVPADFTFGVDEQHSQLPVPVYDAATPID